MRKYIALLLISILATGCSIREIDTNELNTTINTIIQNGNHLANVSSNGYKYYLPNGVSVIDNTSYNEKLYANGNTYFLYIDIVSYYYNQKITYSINKDAYLSRKIVNSNKEGYLEIDKINNRYYIEMMYNYAKIETYVSEKDIMDTAINMCYILTSLKFNDNAIRLLFDQNALNAHEKAFSVPGPKGDTGDYLNVDNYDNTNQEKDEDIITSGQDIIE